MKKVKLSIILCLAIFFFTTLGTAHGAYKNPSGSSPWGSSSMGQLYRKAAVVGKILAYDPVNNSYICFGRLSVNAGNGYKVYEKRKFYRVYPKWGGTDGKLAQNVGQGLKMFGEFEIASGAGNEEKLLAEKAITYDTNTDLQAGMEPAYGPGIGPEPWAGFGVLSLSNKAWTMDLAKSSDVVNSLADLYQVIPIKDNSARNPKESIRSLLNSGDSKQKAREVWSRFQSRWFMEKDLTVLNQMRAGIGGSAYFLGQSGGINGLMESVPVLRPGVDRFMEAVEKHNTGGFTEWASPGVFYGSINCEWDNKGELVNVYYNGPYFKDNEPRTMIESLAKPEKINPEKWPIMGSDKMLAGKIDRKYCWFSGQRVLVYGYTDSDGETRTINVYDGNLANDPDYTLIGYYININKLLTKEDYNYALDVLRELALQGGI